MDIVFLFYDGMTALDVVGPYEVLARLPGAITQSAALQAGPIRTFCGPNMIASHSLAEIQRADVLVVPGAGNATTLKDQPDILQWLRTLHATTQFTTSVCTGSLILGAAGLLQGLNATSHWAVIDKLSDAGATPTHQRVVESGKVITAAGVSAGIDMALTIAAKLCGEDVAKCLQLRIEYDPAPPFDAGSPAKAGPELVNAVKQQLLSGSKQE